MFCDQRSLGEYHVTRLLSHCLLSHGKRTFVLIGFYGCEHIAHFTCVKNCCEWTDVAVKGERIL